MSFPKHAKYRDSGVEWLGQIPSHWRLQPLKRHARQLTEKTDRRQQPVALENIESWTGRFIPTESEFEGEGVAFDSGDILFGKLRPYLAKALVAQSFGEAVGDLIVMRLTDQAFSPFVAYQLRSREVVSIVDGSTFGSKMPRASWDFVGALPLPLPPCDEQVAITAFLDAETVKIDALVEEQRRLIELLKEKRQAVISQAVTKGLDPNAPMKDSGLEWLGRVPAHWDIAAVNYRYEVLLGKMLDEKRISGEHLAPYLRNVDVQWDRINCVDLPQMDFTGDDLQRYSLAQGDLLVCEGGDVGRAAIWQAELDECYYQKALHRLRRRSSTRDHARFMFYILRMATALGVFESNGGKSTIAHLTAEALRRYRFAFPPCGEQEEIVALLDAQIRALDALVVEAESATLLLQERRAALISAAVTGKIDVRDSTDLLAAWAETKADIAAGHFVSESAKAHVARARAMAKRDD